MLPWTLRRHPLFLAYLSLAAVCFFWGTTYLAIRMALESFPPLLLGCVRFILSGSVMLIGSVLRRDELPRGRELGITAFSGVLILGLGNGCLLFAELIIPSGMAGLILTISPFWMVGIEALMPGGERLHGPTIGGMAVGLAGAAMLFSPGHQGGGIDRNMVTGFLLLSVGMAGWSFGSILQRRQNGRAHPVVAGAVQQLCAGLSFAPFVLTFREHAVEWSVRGMAAMLYLVVFGSIVGYSAYAYALDRLPVAIVSMYSYVNAIVAVALGWLFYREPFGGKELAAMIVIFAGVAVVKRYSEKRGARVLGATES